MKDIDFVLPWVDPSDTVWQGKRSKYNGKYKAVSNSDARFRDFDTLRYVFRSIETNCPWYRKIHLITEGHVPNWLDINNERINIVKHDEIYNINQHLPTFNSSSIEMNLPFIKGVSEKFIYLNDDMIFFNKLESGRFFKNNIPVDFLETSLIKRGKLFKFLRGESIWVESLNNNLRLINESNPASKIKNEILFHKTYGIKANVKNFISKYILRQVLWVEHWHHPQPYLKSTLGKVVTEFKDEMMKSSSNKFRQSNDLTHYIYRYWHLFRGDFIPYNYNDAYIKNIITKEDASLAINFLSGNGHIKFVCLNDDEKMHDEDKDIIYELINNFLSEKFPAKSSFEI